MQCTVSTEAGLRRGPGGPVIESLPEGTEVEVVDSRRQWMQVELEGRSGYVSIDQLELRPEYTWPPPEATR